MTRFSDISDLSCPQYGKENRPRRRTMLNSRSRMERFLRMLVACLIRAPPLRTTRHRLVCCAYNRQTPFQTASDTSSCNDASQNFDLSVTPFFNCRILLRQMPYLLHHLVAWQTDDRQKSTWPASSSCTRAMDSERTSPFDSIAHHFVQIHLPAGLDRG